MSDHVMTTSRTEAFSDGVIAILITIMVLELHVPNAATWQALRPTLPVFLAYLLSFVYLGIYWVNHHHLLQLAERVNGRILWANLHLLFWLSLVPFATEWMGEHPHEAIPTALYGAVLVSAGAAFTILQVALVREHGHQSRLASALGRNAKPTISLAAYATSVPVAFYSPGISHAIFAAVALLWFVPDPRIERKLREG
jgi:uncharacterized membrane protein